MAWFCYFETVSGRLVSHGSVPTVPTPGDLTVVDVGSRPTDSLMWDEATRAWVARPAKVLVDRLQDLADDPELSAVWTQLTPTQRTALRNRLIRLFGRYRWRPLSGSAETLDA